MKARPILFRTEMVRALLDGRKTQTRRVCKDQTALTYQFVEAIETVPGGKRFTGWAKKLPGISAFLMPTKCPYGQPGDLLWVRETWCNLAYTNDDPAISYRATTPDTSEEGWGLPPGVKWKPSIHMPRWASRLTLRITEVRAERLQDITPAEAIAEGITPHANSLTIDCDTPNPRDDFRDLWSSNNSPDAWDANPWVWVVCFEVIKANVDAAMEQS